MNWIKRRRGRTPVKPFNGIPKCLARARRHRTADQGVLWQEGDALGIGGNAYGESRALICVSLSETAIAIRADPDLIYPGQVFDCRD